MFMITNNGLSPLSFVNDNIAYGSFKQNNVDILLSAYENIDSIPSWSKNKLTDERNKLEKLIHDYYDELMRTSNTLIHSDKRRSSMGDYYDNSIFDMKAVINNPMFYINENIDMLTLMFKAVDMLCNVDYSYKITDISNELINDNRPIAFSPDAVLMLIDDVIIHGYTIEYMIEHFNINYENHNLTYISDDMFY